MKRSFDPAPYLNILDAWLLALRLALGSFMLTHGFPKLDKLNGDDVEFADPFGLGPGASLGLAVTAEFFGSIMIILGLGTRVAAVLLMITMVTAAFIIHADDPFGKKELALLYLLGYATLFVLGSGKFSIDYLINKHWHKPKTKRKTNAANGYLQPDPKKSKN